MVLIAESGSTKTSWLEAGQEEPFETKGLNPFFVSAADVEQILSAELPGQIATDKVDAVHFYGAGCSSVKRCEIISSGLQTIFPKATIEVEHDLLAAARALCQREPGIACIVGTGSNTCRYDGENITANIPALGYVLGDEGSAGWLGQAIVRDYIYGRLPAPISTDLENGFDSDKDVILDKIYKGPFPNVYLGNYATLLAVHLELEYSKELISGGFEALIDNHISQYGADSTEPVHFVGSVAAAYSDILSEVLDSKGYMLGKVIKTPIFELARYHQ